ncbi:HAD family hydrolase [Rufibacter soli]
MHPFQIVLFDFDGTLCATENAILHTFQATFAQRGLTPPSEADLKAALGTGAHLPELLLLLHPPLQQQGPSMLEEWVLHYRHLYETEGASLTTLFEGTEEVLALLRQKEITCAVLSNKGQRAIELALEGFGLLHYFDLIIGDNPKLPLLKKPNPMAYLQVIQPKYPQVPPAQILMVGDTHADLEFANNAGLVSCWAAYGYGAKEACLAANPTYTIHSLPELSVLL